ncbi:hypothetical protein LP420_35535 [Massilia sp. B-10]|nr:hypothetical protein LP420_35535 [Massilia sp. B-10]
MATTCPACCSAHDAQFVHRCHAREDMGRCRQRAQLLRGGVGQLFGTDDGQVGAIVQVQLLADLVGGRRLVAGQHDGGDA